jgi:hypothetical protein
MLDMIHLEYIKTQALLLGVVRIISGRLAHHIAVAVVASQGKEKVVGQREV